MFDPSVTPRVFAMPPGADFPRALVAGLIDRVGDAPPEALARVELYVNTRRMQRRITTLFDAGPARLLPRVRLVTDLSRLPGLTDLPPPVSPLRRRLEISTLVARLIEAQPDIAPRAAVFDLADSLAGLLEEMQGEGITPETIRDLDVSDQSGHWARSLEFIDIVTRYLSNTPEDPPDAEARQRAVVQALAERWATEPPDHPVIVAGSTGSRGTTRLFMEAVARLPQGAVVLPGFDFDLPTAMWDQFDDAEAGEDHPQFRFARLMRDLTLSAPDIKPWNPGKTVSNPARNRLISLALRPAPVTDQWVTEGRHFEGVTQAASDLTLIEAASPRIEANAIALVLREALDQGRPAALITPDRMLTRQVTAALDRWGILPDDSAGRPLPLTAPGRFLRHVSELFGQVLTSSALLTLLKHPLTNTGSEGRGDHLRWTRDLELHLRRNGPPFPTARDLILWAGSGTDDGRLGWAEWVGATLCGHDGAQTRGLQAHLAALVDTATALAAGPVSSGSGELWEKEAGQEALRCVQELEREAPHGAEMPPAMFRDLFASILNRAEVRDPVAAHPGVMIWGTLEARVQGAERVILAGLNDGIWPELPAPDPWLNRKMRLDAGLLLPERRIGLAAHDFQQAIAAPEVFLTRAIRDAEAETVPSRWLNRLTNLLDGMSAEGSTALGGMRMRGQHWATLAETIDRPPAAVPPAPRPSPRPPVTHRPRQLSVTRIRTLIRDPYAIYARQILRLKPLDPLHQSPDAPLRGTVLHRILHRFAEERADADGQAARDLLLRIADEVLAEQAPWPAARILWRTRLEQVADWFIRTDAGLDGSPVALEVDGGIHLDRIGFTLTGTADRIDRRRDGSLAIIDYKTGTIPSAKQQKIFDKQLLLEAVIAEAGGFRDLPPTPVTALHYIGLGTRPDIKSPEFEPGGFAAIQAELETLLGAFLQRDQGYTSRRMMEKDRFGGDFDHLARFGEWDDSDDPAPQEVGQ